MKKIIALLLSLALLLFCAASLAESADTATAPEKYDIGTISINGAFALKCALPDGYKVTPRYVSNDQVIATVSSSDLTKPTMQLSVAFDETYGDVDRLNDLNDEELAVLEETFTSVDPTVEISYDETHLGTRLLIARQHFENLHYVDFLSIYKGYFIEFVVMAGQQAESRELTDEQYEMCIQFLTDVDFVPVGEGESTDNVELAGNTFLALITDYDAASNALNVVLEMPLKLDADVVTSFEVGGTVDLSGDVVVIDTLERYDKDYIVNEDYWFLLNEEGSYNVYWYDSVYVSASYKVNPVVTDALVFVDDIDPESLELLEEPTLHTAAEFLAILAEDSLPGFVSDNTLVTFDENGTLVKIERIYVPIQ